MDVNISLEDESPKPSSNNTSSKKITLAERIEIENTFFKINYYFGGTLETEIEKVTPKLIEKYKDKDDMDMDMGEFAGMVIIIRMNILNIYEEENRNLYLIKLI